MPIRDHDREVGSQLAELRNELIAPRLFRLKYGYPFFEGDNFDRWRGERGTMASLRFVGLCNDAHDVVPFAEERTQRRRREFRRSPKDDPHLEALVGMVVVFRLQSTDVLGCEDPKLIRIL